MSIPPPNTLSEVAVKLEAVLSAALGSDVDFHIGAPIDAIPKDSTSKPVVNIFFYRFGASGFVPDTLYQSPNNQTLYNVDPLYIRIYCLISVFSNSTTNAAEERLSQGVLNLRLLGMIMLALHNTPVVLFSGTSAQTNLQIVFKELSSEEINQIWSTQGEATYRTSIAYELALVPIAPVTEEDEADIVSEGGATLMPLKTGNPPEPTPSPKSDPVEPA